MYVEFMSLYSCLIQTLGTTQVAETAPMTAALLLTSVLVTCDSAHSWRLYRAAHWNTRPPGPGQAIPLSRIILTPSQPSQSLPYLNSAEQQARARQVSILKFDWSHIVSLFV